MVTFISTICEPVNKQAVTMVHHVNMLAVEIDTVLVSVTEITLHCDITNLHPQGGLCTSCSKNNLKSPLPTRITGFLDRPMPSRFQHTSDITYNIFCCSKVYYLQCILP